MSYTRKNLDGAQVEFTVTVAPAEYQPHLTRAAARLSERAAIKGFRKGHAPYDIVKRELGEMAIMQEALETVVQEKFYDAVTSEKLETIGMPKIDLEKLAPGNEVVFRATVALMPSVVLPLLSTITVTTKKKTVGDKDVHETIDAIRGMQATEIIKSGAAGAQDKIIVDMNMLLDGVPLDGGQSKDHQVYLSEPHYIPGFAEQLVGLKKGETKKFSLTFNKDHYQKHLAGKLVDFDVTVKDVYERQLPGLSDDLAKRLGQNSAEELKKLIQNNLEEEAERKALQQTEIEILDQLIAQSRFDPIPAVIIDSERQKIFYELTQDLERHGISVEQYLADIKKDEKTLFEDFRAQAEKRAKAALISRQVAREQNIRAEEEEVDKEIAMMKDVYAQNKDVLEKLGRREVRDTIAVSIQNKKVMAWLKGQTVEKNVEKKTT